MSLPKYRCYKVVEAVRIRTVFWYGDGRGVIDPADRSLRPITPMAGWMERFKGNDTDTGYFIRYEDGYESWSPSKAFEEGYTRIEEPSEERLYRFHLDCGRMGSLGGLFTATEADIKVLIGETVYFGEVLGKHSDISAVMEEEHFKMVSKDPDLVRLFNKYRLATGTNPLEIYADQDDEDYR